MAKSPRTDRRRTRCYLLTLGQSFWAAVVQTDRWLPLTSAEPKIGADCPAAEESSTRSSATARQYNLKPQYKDNAQQAAGKLGGCRSEENARRGQGVRGSPGFRL